MGVIIQDMGVGHNSSASAINLYSCENSGFNRKLVMMAIAAKDGSIPTPDLEFDNGGDNTPLTIILNEFVDIPYGGGNYRITVGYLDNPPLGEYINLASWGSVADVAAYCWCLSNAKDGIDIAADSDEGNDSVNVTLGAGDKGDLALTAAIAIAYDNEVTTYYPTTLSGISGVIRSGYYTGTTGNGAYGYDYYASKNTNQVGWSGSHEMSNVLMAAVGIKAAIGKHGMHP